MYRAIAWGLCGAAAAAALGCGDDPLVPIHPSSLAVSVGTTGEEADDDGFVLLLDGVIVGPLSEGESWPSGRIALGDHSLELQGVAPNCRVLGENPRTARVGLGSQTSVRFEVACALTGMYVVTTTVGADPPTGHIASIDGDTNVIVPSNGSLRIGRLAPGAHSVFLNRGGDNCAVADPNPAEIDIDAGANPQVSFSVTCLARFAAIEVSALTTGVDRVQSSYSISIDGVEQVPSLPRTGSVGYSVAAGEHAVTLSGVPENCTVTGDAERSVNVETGGLVKDSAEIAYEIECVRRWGVAFTRSGGVYVAAADGTDALRLVSGGDAEWSPDGTLLVFKTAPSCSIWDYYYYGSDCGLSGLSVMSTEGGEPMVVTTNAGDSEPTWHPDGERLAFTRNGRLVTVRSDGTGVQGIDVSPSIRTADPTWSPDGLKLAFTCEVQLGNLDVCTVAVDGTGFTRLTDEPGRDAHPVWSSDGSTIAFVTSRFGFTTEVAGIDAGGGAVSRVAPFVGATEIARAGASSFVFAGTRCDPYDGCVSLGLFMMGTDGSGLTQLTSGSDHVPSWRP